jgi:hypothetical protein
MVILLRSMDYIATTEKQNKQNVHTISAAHSHTHKPRLIHFQSLVRKTESGEREWERVFEKEERIIVAISNVH